MRDGKHMLVMLSSVPISEDAGNACTLPNGQKVKLRTQFTCSGLYEIGTPATPIWTVTWYEEEGYVHLSDDGRYAVRINRFGGGYRGQPPSSHWCLRFYDKGVQTKSYNTNELVDYPSLMEFTSSDWHILWIDPSVYLAEVRNGFIDLKTTTHDRFRFDVSTGETVREFRLWRWVARGSIASLAAFGLIAGWFIYHRWVTRPQPTLPVRTVRLQFSIRALFVVTTLIAGLFGVYLVAAHVAVFLASVLLTVWLTILAVRSRRCAWSTSSVRIARCQRVSLWLVVAASWLILYALSFGPIMALAMHFYLPQDVRKVLARVVFAPVCWLYENHQLEWMSFYFKGWGG